MFAIDAPHNEELVRLLLEHGASVMPESKQGTNALSLAHNEGSATIIRLLEEARQHETLSDEQRGREERGHELLYLASAGDFGRLHELLHEGVVEFANQEGNTALIFAAAYSDADATIAMIEAGFDVSHTNEADHNVFNVAARKDDLDYLMQLIEYYRHSNDYPSVLMELRLNSGHFSATVERAVLEVGIRQNDLPMILHAVRHGAFQPCDAPGPDLMYARGGRQRPQREGIHPAAVRHSPGRCPGRGGAPVAR